MKRRDLAAVCAAAALATLATQAGGAQWLGGLSVDLGFWLRHQLFGERQDARQAPIAVVAIDEETYRRPPFRDLPKVMWTQAIARVLARILDADAKVVGFDVIYSTSVERYIPGFDRELLVALNAGAASGRVVLGKVQHEVKPISPHPGYSFAVGHQKNIRPLNFFEDSDGVIRRMPLAFRAGDAERGERVEPSMPVELAARFLGETLEAESPARVKIGGREITAPSARGRLIDFRGGAPAAATYSLADLAACDAKSDTAFFRKHFAGRVVLIGTVLDVEDRKLTAKRFVTAPALPAATERCVLPVMTRLYHDTAVRDTIPGVYLLADALDDLIRGDVLGELDRPEVWGVALALALAAGLAVLGLRPWAGAAAVAAGAAAWALIVAGALRQGTMLPLLDPLAAAAVAVTALYGYRFTVADRDKLFLRRAFSLYLPAAEVERIAEGNERPELGGEVRELTVFFLDIEKFTGFAEGRTPADLVAGLNAFLSRATESVERHHGFVDKYLGDGLIAVFGAPLPDPGHARNAVLAALEIAVPGEGEPFRTRTGINSGEMLVGNIGSTRRFNYTVMGDAVNLAARLEGANKAYGTRILASDRTRALCGDTVAFREIDRVRVVGRAEPVAIFEPGTAPPDYAAALARYRAGEFADALRGFDAIATLDSPAAALAERCRRLIEAPPAAWDGTTELETK